MAFVVVSAVVFLISITILVALWPKQTIKLHSDNADEVIEPILPER